MTDAQVGLALATPIIVVFAGVLYRMGVLQKTGALAAILCSLAVAMILFFGQ